MSISIRVADFSTDFSAIEKIRYAVFQIEQSISSEDEFDGKDRESIHLIAYFEFQAVGTLRIRNIGGAIAKIERLAVLKDFRSHGIGRKMMEEAIAYIKSFKKSAVTYSIIKIHAQAYLEKFYTNLGFITQGERFMEAGIDHVLMMKNI